MRRTRKAMQQQHLRRILRSRFAIEHVDVANGEMSVVGRHVLSRTNSLTTKLPFLGNGTVWHRAELGEFAFLYCGSSNNGGGIRIFPRRRLPSPRQNKGPSAAPNTPPAPPRH